MRVLLIGPPGAGKGTQAARIAAHFDLARIATGDLLRQEITADTQLRRAAKAYVDRGDLVPDDLVITITKARVVKVNTKGGHVLDGYPRTLAQAEAAHRWATARGVPFDLALWFEIGTEELLARLVGRARREGRSDDTEETIRHRLEVFQAQTSPLVDYYRQRGILVRIQAVGPVDAIAERICAVLHWHKANALAAGADWPEWTLGSADGNAASAAIS
jgi:adenylate kinase